MDILKYLFICVGGYLLGSVSISIILSRAFGVDIRKKGSGNAGATNMARSFGLLAGFATLAGDFLKAVIVMYVGWRLCGDWGLMAGGMACTTGHCFPLFYDFRGGKGISVGAAIGLMIDWRVFVGIIAVFLIAAFLSKKASFGSLCADGAGLQGGRQQIVFSFRFSDFLFFDTAPERKRVSSPVFLLAILRA